MCRVCLFCQSHREDSDVFSSWVEYQSSKRSPDLPTIDGEFGGKLNERQGLSALLHVL